MIAVFAVAAAAACSTTPQVTPSTPAGPTAPDGTLRVTANAAIHSIYPTLESLTIEYRQPVALPDQPPAALFEVDDALGDRSGRTVTDVYSTDQADPGATDQARPGRFVHVQLEPVANPDPTAGGPWIPASTAGRAVIRTGWNFTFRQDFSDLTVTQSFDAHTTDGQLIQPAGALPTLTRADVQWPDFAGFTIDEVLPGRDGDIHFSYYLPPGYDQTRSYPMVLTLPGYGGLLHSLDEETRGVNVFSDRNALAWAQAAEDVIVVAPQLAGGSASAGQVVELTEHFLQRYSVDPTRVYAVGYSAGGELMSQVLNTRADLFAAYVHASSRWNGSVDDVVAHRVPVYIFMAQSDEYYGQDQARDDHETLLAAYAAADVPADEAADLAVLNLPDDSYFSRQGIDYFHDAGQVVADDTTLRDWVLGQRR